MFNNITVVGLRRLALSPEAALLEIRAQCAALTPQPAPQLHYPGLACGAKLVQVHHAAGHSNPVTTMRYAHGPDDLDDNASIMSSYKTSRSVE